MTARPATPTTPTHATTHAPAPGGDERDDLLAALAAARRALRHTVRGLADEQAAAAPTASALNPGGLIKHVTQVEERWADFIRRGPAAFGDPAGAGPSEQDRARFHEGFRMLPGETLAALLTEYAEVARRTDALVGELPELDATHPLPAFPWFPPGVRWSARRVLLHLVAETAQHAGHADILRETIDGATSTG